MAKFEPNPVGPFPEYDQTPLPPLDKVNARQKKHGDSSQFVDLVPGLLLLVDIVAMVSAGMFMYGIYLAGDPAALPFENYVAALSVAAIIAQVVFRSQGLYKADVWQLNGPRTAILFRGWLITVGALLLLGVFSHTIESFSRIWLTGWGISSFILILILRGTIMALVKRSIAARPARIAIFGDGENAILTAAALSENSTSTRIVGIYDDKRPDADKGSSVKGVPFRGDTEALIAACQNDEVDDVLIALPRSEESRIYKVYLKLVMVPVKLRLVPDLLGLSFTGNDYVRYGTFSALNLSGKPLAGWDRVLKTCEDKSLGLLALLLCLPLLAVCAVAVRLESPGPVFFRQVRRGYNNRNFEILKFRTLRQNNEDPDGAIDVTSDDPRVTHVGAFLRRFNLDELPQLINVLLGDMSIVGPRPHSLGARAGETLYENVAEQYTARHQVKPGITGWAQVNGLRGETDTEEKFRKRVEADLYYIKNWSVWLDLEIIFRTVFVTITDR